MVNFGIEVELIIVDWGEKPVNHIPELWDANEAVLAIAAQTRSELAKAIEVWKISKELDASQIEIRTSGWQSLEQSIKEIYNLYFLIEKVVQHLGYKILMGGVPSEDFLPRASNMDRYKEIHRLLLEYWGFEAQKATNIAGIHFHIELGRELGKEEIKKVMLISNWVREAIEKEELNRIWMSEKRYILMQLVVDTLVKAKVLDGENPVASSIRPFAFKNPQEVIDYFGISDGWIVLNYSLVGIKQKDGIYTLEIRSPDTIWPAAAIPNYLTRIWSKLLDIFEADNEMAWK